jgi:hypothetical protein
MSDVKLRPVPWDKKGELGIVSTKLDALRAKEGDWIGVLYNGKSTSAQVKKVKRESAWPENLIWISPTEQEELGLPDISKNDPVNLPPSGLEVTVWKHMFTQSKLLLPAAATFVMLLVGLFLTAFVQGGIFPGLKTAFGIVLLGLGVVSAATTAYGVYTQKQ